MSEKKLDAFTDRPSLAVAVTVKDTVAEVPWDPSLLKGRDCGACACYFEQANPENALQVQGFCRRLPADMQSVRSLEQRRDLQGNVVLKDGKPVMQPAQVIGYIFKPTKRDGTCFDGWRPVGTLPGERLLEGSLRQLGDRLLPFLRQLPPELRTVAAAVFGLELTPEQLLDPDTRKQ